MASASALELDWNNPQALEVGYRQARRENRAGQFAAEVDRQYTAAPDNPLFAAWHYRLEGEGAAREGRLGGWRLAIPFSLATSLLFWLLTWQWNTIPPSLPPFFILWAPATASVIIAYLAVASFRATTGRRAWLVPTLTILAILALGAYSYLIRLSTHDLDVTYQLLAVLHLPILATLAVGFFLAGLGSTDANRHAVALKAAEVVLTGGIIGAAAMAFVAIVFGLFSAIGVTFPEPLQRYLMIGVPGLVPIIAMAVTYDPRRPPVEQRLDQGVAKLILTVARLFLPLSLLVGVIYIALIPANFNKPFEQRDVLIVYNAMLFGVMALLVFATPLALSDVSERWRVWLRRGILSLAVLTVLVSLYALSATVYRTALNGLTPNRLTVIGWNILNVGLLVLFLARQIRAGLDRWIPATQWVLTLGTIGYAAWSLFVTLVVPWLFR